MQYLFGPLIENTGIEYVERNIDVAVECYRGVVDELVAARRLGVERHAADADDSVLGFGRRRDSGMSYRISFYTSRDGAARFGGGDMIDAFTQLGIFFGQFCVALFQSLQPRQYLVQLIRGRRMRDCHKC